MRQGESEEIVGEALGAKRPEVLIATKFRFPTGKRAPTISGASRHYIIAECERSLKRLGTDWIDLYQIHQWDGQTPLEETMEALDRLIQQGKVRYIGCSNYSGWHIMKALGVARMDGRQPFVSQQIHYTLQAREAEYELVPISIDQGLGILVWSPLAGGLLSGKFRRDNREGPEGSRHFGRKWVEPPIYDEDKLYDIIDVLLDVAKAHNCSAARVALAWLIHQPAVTSVIIGGRTKEQFADNLAAADLKLSEDELKRLDKVSRPNLAYPYWHQSLVGERALQRRRPVADGEISARRIGAPRTRPGRVNCGAAAAFRRGLGGLGAILRPHDKNCGWRDGSRSP